LCHKGIPVDAAALESPEVIKHVVVELSTWYGGPHKVNRLVVDRSAWTSRVVVSPHPRFAARQHERAATSHRGPPSRAERVKVA